MAENDGDATVCFSVEDLFSTYEELEGKVKAYESETFVQFRKHDA